MDLLVNPQTSLFRPLTPSLSYNQPQVGIQIWLHPISNQIEPSVLLGCTSIIKTKWSVVLYKHHYVSHLPLVGQFSWVKSCLFDRNPHDLEVHVRTNDFTMQIFVISWIWSSEFSAVTDRKLSSQQCFILHYTIDNRQQTFLPAKFNVNAPLDG